MGTTEIDVNLDTGEMTSDGRPLPRQMPLFEGYVIEKATLHLSAGVEIPVSLSRLLKMGESATIIVQCGDSSVTIDATVTKRGFALEKGQDGDRIPVTRHVLVGDADSVVVVS